MRIRVKKYLQINGEGHWCGEIVEITSADLSKLDPRAYQLLDTQKTADEPLRPMEVPGQMGEIDD